MVQMGCLLISKGSLPMMNTWLRHRRKYCAAVLFFFLVMAYMPYGYAEQRLASLKGRFNFASFDCAARVLATNQGAKSPTSILLDNKDTYLLNLCSSQPKFVILELCADIKIDTLVLANFELFSSTVKEFKVSASRKYPPPAEKGWRTLGTFLAANSRVEQVFTIPTIQKQTNVFSRFLRIDFLSHYGNEYYCPVSSIRVYGKTMIDDFEEDAGTASTGVLANGTAERPVFLSSNSLSTGKNATNTEQALITQSPSDNWLASYSTPNSLNTTLVYTTLSSNNDPAKTSQPTAARAVRAVDSFQDLLRHFEQQNQCASSSPSAGSSDSEKPPNLGEDNIFKAIYERLQQLERNVTLSAKKFESEISRLQKGVYLGHEEIIDEDSGLPIVESIEARLQGLAADISGMRRKLQSINTPSMLQLLELILIFLGIQFGLIMVAFLAFRRGRLLGRTASSLQAQTRAIIQHTPPVSLQTPRFVSPTVVAHLQRDQSVPDHRLCGRSPMKPRAYNEEFLLDESNSDLLGDVFEFDEREREILAGTSTVASPSTHESGKDEFQSSPSSPPGLPFKNKMSRKDSLDSRGRTLSPLKQTIARRSAAASPIGRSLSASPKADVNPFNALREA